MQETIPNIIPHLQSIHLFQRTTELFLKLCSNPPEYQFVMLEKQGKARYQSGED